jgi:hypothetical protein
VVKLWTFSGALLTPMLQGLLPNYGAMAMFSPIALYGCEAEHLHRYRQRIERRLFVAGWKDGTHWCIRQSHSLRPSSPKAGRIEVAVAARPFES